MAKLIVSSIETSIVGILAPNPDEEYRMSVGDRVRARVQCQINGLHEDETDFDLTSELELLVNPALFAEPGASYFPTFVFPSYGMYARIPENPTGTIKIPLQGNHDTRKANENAECTLTVIDNNNFYLDIDFWLTEDVNGFIKGRPIQNRYRFSKVSHDSRSEWKNDFPSVYNEDKELVILVAARQNGATFRAEARKEFTARWYNSDLYGENSSEFGVSELTLRRDGQVVDALSLYEDTELYLQLDLGSGVIASDCKILLYEKSNEGNSGSFVNQLKLKSAELVNAQASANQVLDIIYEPTSFDQISERLFMSCIIKASELDPDKRYVVVFKPKLTVSTEYTVAFTTEPYTTDPGDDESVLQGDLKPVALPKPINFEIYGVVYDYTFESLANVVVVPEERLRFKLFINEANYDNQAQLSNPNWAGEFFKKFRSLNVEIRDANDNEYFWSTYWWKPEADIYPEHPDLTWETIGDYKVVSIDLRNCWKNNQSLPDWTGRDMKIRWTLRFFYDEPTEWECRYAYESYFKVRAYDNELDGINNIIEWVILRDAETGQIIGNICDANQVSVTAKLTDSAMASATVYRAICLLDVASYGAAVLLNGNIKEYDPGEVFFGAQVGQLQQYPIIDGMTFFDEETGIATFVVDVTSLQEGVEWRVSVIAKPK